MGFSRRAKMLATRQAFSWGNVSSFDSLIQGRGQVHCIRALSLGNMSSFDLFNPIQSYRAEYFEMQQKHFTGGWGEGVVMSVCDDTKNMNKTESETFFRYQIFQIQNPILISILNFFPIPNPILSKKFEKFRNQYRYRYQILQNRVRYFFRYQIFPIPNPILFSIPIFSNNESDTYFNTNFFRYRIRFH